MVEPAKRAVTLTGYTRSRKTVTLACEVSGKALKVNYDMGQVIGNAPFLLVDTTFIDLEIQGTNRTLERLDVARKQQVSRIGFLEKESRRILSLFQRGSTTEQKRDATLEELEQARLELESVDIQIDATRVVFQQQQERRLRHALQAPLGWTVTERHIEAGELVSAGAPVARVSDFQHLVVPLSVSDQELTALQALPPDFSIRLDGRAARAAIHWINPRFDEKTRKLEIELLIRDFAGRKRGGLACRLPLKITANGILVPKAAVLNHYENPRVFLRPEGDEVQVLILGDSGDHLILADNPRLPPGAELMLPENGRKQTSSGVRQP